VFCDLRGYTAFTETAEPEEVLAFLREYHGALGPLVSQFEGTLDQFSGDGIMVFFKDPVPCPDPAERAVKMAMAMREVAGELGIVAQLQTRIYATLGDTAGSAVGARDFSSAGGAPLPARFSTATRASARTLGSSSLSSSRSSGTTDSIPGCPGPRRPRCHAARLRTKEIPSRVSVTKAGMASGFSG